MRTTPASGGTSAGRCALCGASAAPAALAEAGWMSPEARARLLREHPEWRREDGACPACVQWALLQLLLEGGEAALHDGIQSAWPLDAEAVFGALPTPLRMHADPRYSGRGVTLAMVDSAFQPHPDLTCPKNRVRAWVDAGSASLLSRRFPGPESPRWPGWDTAAPSQWHGLMTSAVAAGNGWLSHGFYRGLAGEADLVLIQVRDARGRITSESIARALRWLRDHGPDLGVRVVSLSVAGEIDAPLQDHPVDREVAAMVSEGMTVLAAAGNDGRRRLVPPATAPAALTVGGIDDKNTFDHAAIELWHGNYGEAVTGATKPELVAPSIWVVAPILPGTEKAREAAGLFASRAEGEAEVERRIREQKLITPHYQHVEGTSVAAPLVASVVACMLEANPKLTPRLVREVLLASTRPIPGAPPERQGAGAIDAGQAVARALRERHGAMAGRALSPQAGRNAITFSLHDHDVREVRILGSWDGWRRPGLAANLIEPGVWQVALSRPPAGRYLYKFLLDGVRWLDDPDNPHKSPDGFGRFNSVLKL